MSYVDPSKSGQWGGPPPGGPPPGYDPRTQGQGYDTSYQQYQEQPGGHYPMAPMGAMNTGAMGTGAPGAADASMIAYQANAAMTTSIDKANGIAPRRITDCVCVVLFVLYVIGMIIAVCIAHSKGNVQRLTHGMDATAQLCGVDGPVWNKSFLFYCRASPNETVSVPQALNLWNPVCVSSCPRLGEAPIECLMPATHHSKQISGGQFGNVETYFVTMMQSYMMTKTYDTKLFRGRYCLPEDQALRSTVLYGPLGFKASMHHLVGSFQDCWGVIFLCVLVAIALSYSYIFLVKLCAKLIVSLFLVIVMLAFFAMGGFMVLAVFTLIPNMDNPFKGYEDVNPFFQRYTTTVAAVLSTVMGTLCIFAAVGMIFTLRDARKHFMVISTLVKCACDCSMSMPFLMVMPVLEAIWKFFLMWILCYNFMPLCSCGFYNERIVNINGEGYMGLKRSYHFDYYWGPAIIFYIIGGFWIMEMTHSFGHYILTYTVVGWFFTPKSLDSKVPPKFTEFLDGIVDSFRYALGSICLGAFLIPAPRAVRVSKFIIKKMFCSCRCKSPDQEDDFADSGDLPSRDAYADLLIRANDFLQAMGGAKKYWAFHTCRKHKGKCEIVTVAGVTTVGFLSALIAFVMCSYVKPFNDPSSSSYIFDPVSIAIIAFVLCGAVAYGFMMLIGFTADLLLYCYIWNKKFNDKTIEQHAPDEIWQLTGYDHHSKGYPYFGKAHPNMYVSTWLDWSADKGSSHATHASATSKPHTQTEPPASATGGYAQQYHGAPGPSQTSYPTAYRH